MKLLTTLPQAPALAPRGARRRRLTRLGYWALVLGLAAGNAWWSWADRPPVALREVEAWVARGRLDDAERELRRQLARSPAHGEARMKLARVLAKRGDYLGSARELHEVPEWWPTKAEAAFLEGQAYKLLNLQREAEAAWRVCTAGDPLHPVPPLYATTAAKELIGNCILEGRFDDARAAVWRAYETAAPGDRAAVLVMRMRVELERIAHEEAVVKLRSYVEAAPDDWQARRALALEELATGHPEEAERQVAACLKLRPEDPGVWRAKLEVAHQKGDREATLAAVAALPKSADGDAEVWKFRGLAREWSGDLAGAAEAFGRAARLNPREGEFLYKLGMAEQRLGRGAEGREHVRKSRELRQADSELKDAYHHYLEVSGRGGPADKDYPAAVGRLAAACRRLGWFREADAWAALGGPP